MPHEPAETLANPILIAEVVSESTADYRSIPSFRDYLLMHRCRDGEEWRIAKYTSHEDVVHLTGVPLDVHVGDLFTGIAIP